MGARTDAVLEGSLLPFRGSERKSGRERAFASRERESERAHARKREREGLREREIRWRERERERELACTDAVLAAGSHLMLRGNASRKRDQERVRGGEREREN